ncbi:MAG: putative zinc-binding peptidase [Luteolibacter sp.]|uniref:zinc-binding metallopeptidase family protein n=1 Tax=Luteolibacter sp. TaxID=1962973 RepID=UPI003263395B
MINFQCGNCGGRVFFENSRCLSCQTDLGFVPGDLSIGTFQPAAPDFTLQRIDAAGLFRRCGNHLTAGACNWMVPVDSPVPFCPSCRLSHIIPDLSKPRNPRAWLKLEAAKRRLIYSLLSLGLPVRSKEEDPATGLAFDFLEDTPPGTPGDDHVFTGHANGLITINLDEADDPKRERAREMMGEMYRTVLGHFRHEVGHYYWDVLVNGTPRLEQFRNVFGDERGDYASMLANHYANGAPPDWQQRHVSPYAASHPWEDWAETWAHYMHIMDTLETAATEGLIIQHAQDQTIVLAPLGRPFSDIAAQWLDVSVLLNGLNRSMGLPDPYPFVLAETVIQKLTLIHDWIAFRDPLPASGLPG